MEQSTGFTSPGEFAEISYQSTKKDFISNLKSAEYKAINQLKSYVSAVELKTYDIMMVFALEYAPFHQPINPKFKALREMLKLSDTLDEMFSELGSDFGRILSQMDFSLLSDTMTVTGAAQTLQMPGIRALVVMSAAVGKKNILKEHLEANKTMLDLINDGLIIPMENFDPSDDLGVNA